MTISIRVTDKVATRFFSKPPDVRVKRMVRAWHKSNISHCFESKKSFKKAVRRNRKTLESRDKIKKLFTQDNYLFSTKAKCREETLYFGVKDPPTTGRLRQQHRKGPLAKIDEKAREHRFVSRERFCELPEEKPKRLAKFHPYERRVEVDKHHIEFACKGRSVEGAIVLDWHQSGGTVNQTAKTVKESKQEKYLQCRIDSALKNILGIRSEKIMK
jgi:hypothetical protein